MSPSDVNCIPEAFNALKKEIISLREELDNTKQELYASKRNIQLLEALKTDYQSEVELLQLKIDAEKNILEQKIIQLEEYNTSLKLNFNDHVHSLELNLSKCEEDNLLLRNEIELLKKSHTSVNNIDNINKLNDEIFNLKSENFMIKESSEELKVILESLQNQNTILEETISQSNHEIDELQNSLRCKKEELIEANEMVDKLNDELISMRNELEAEKNQLLDKGSQGNSLFAEVDDRRIYLQKMINNMKREYLAIKQERAKQMREIHHMKIENRTLLEKWKADVNEKDDDHYTELKAFKGRIEVLENLLEDYKKDLIEQQTPCTKNSFEGFEFYSLMIKNKNKQIEDLREQLSSRTLTEILLSKALTEANEEKRKWKLEAAIKSNELGSLEIEESDIENNLNEVYSNSSKTLKALENIKLAKDEKQEDCLQKLCSNINFTKLEEIENVTSGTNIFFEKNIPKQAENLKLYKNIDSTDNILREKLKVLENEVTGQQSSIHNGTCLFEDDKNEFSENLNQHSTGNNNMSVVILEDSFDEIVVSDKIEATIKTEVENFEVKKEELITKDFKGDNIIPNLSNNGTSEKENLHCDKTKIDIKSSESSKKVTFSENTISPKITALRKCKKVIVSKPVLFTSSVKK